MGKWFQGTIVLAFAMTITSVAPAWAAESLSLEDCLTLALDNNGMLIAARQYQVAAEARVQQARAIPQPSLDYDSDMQEGILDLDRPGETYLGLSTTLEFPGRRGLRIGIANRESERVRAEVSTQRLDLALEVKIAFFELLLERQKLDFARSNLELVMTFIRLANARFETGDVGKVEVLRAQVEQASATNALRSAENSEQLAAARLALLIGKKTPEPIVIREDFPKPSKLPDLEFILDFAATSRPEVFALQNAIERESLAEKHSRKGRLPDLDIGVARHRIEGEGTFWDVTLSVPLPIFQQQYRGEISEARASREGLKHELAYLQAQIAIEVQASFRQAVTALERVDLYTDKLLDEAKEVYDMYVFGYEQGEINGLELNAARLSLVDTHTEYAEAAFDYAIAVATMERAVGQNPEGVL